MALRRNLLAALLAVAGLTLLGVAVLDALSVPLLVLYHGVER